MVDLDDMVAEIERKEADEDMHFSMYSIPSYYNDEDVDGN